jgi:hypothetical protein
MRYVMFLTVCLIAGCGQIVDVPVTTYENSADTQLFIGDFAGVLPNSCAVTAAEVINHQTGLVSGEITNESYKNTATAIGYTPTGTPMPSFRAYYEQRGFSMNETGYPLDSCLAYSMVAIKRNEGCGVAILYLFPNDNTSHLETVVGVKSESAVSCEIHLNSWGRAATLTGFSNGTIKRSFKSQEVETHTTTRTYTGVTPDIDITYPAGTTMEAYFVCPK